MYKRQALWGVAKNTARTLSKIGIRNVLEFQQADPTAVRKSLGVVGERLFRELNGISCLELEDVYKRQVCGIPESLLSDAQSLPGDWLLDGEIIGTTFHAFDLLEQDGSLRAKGFKDRIVALLNFLSPAQVSSIHFVSPIYGVPMKKRMFEIWRCV